ncbi:hypothetical protein M0812_20057 [Anaeramoeba flamelloides]|uniref:Uncharacterized protein n=1 Tax=Anaeramoeba flamelloides TaxID=1746091 RepID=A0AAV7YZ78_9EUKA|nr:hypothetical protein M0812_20057 [Anaeramoeba flamelloides]
MRRIPRRRSLTGVTHVETMLMDHIRSLVPKALELDGYLDENKDPNVKIHEKEENVQKKVVAIKGNQDSNVESKEKKKNKAKKKIKNVKHDPVINSKQKSKEKEKEKKKITSRCKGNGKSNIPEINKESSGPKTKERSSRPDNNQVTDQSKTEEIQIEKETNSETLCLPSKRRVRLKTEISNGKLIKTIQTRIGEDIRKLQNIESWLKDETFSNFIQIKNVDNQPLFLNENYFVQCTQCNSVITAIKYNMERHFTSSKHCTASLTRQ